MPCAPMNRSFLRVVGSSLLRGAALAVCTSAPAWAAVSWGGVWQSGLALLALALLPLWLAPDRRQIAAKAVVPRDES
jgi:hypothetical protein